jgi:hypothetical protein
VVDFLFAGVTFTVLLFLIGSTIGFWNIIYTRGRDREVQRVRRF